MDGSGKDENFMLLVKHSLSNEPDSRVLTSASSFRSESSLIGLRSSYGINSASAGYTGPRATATQTQLVQMNVLRSNQVHSLHHHTGDIALNIDHSDEKNPSIEEAKSIPCSKEICADQDGVTSELSDPKANDALCRECSGQGFFSFLYSFFTKVNNPHEKFVQNWNRWIVIFCLMAIFVDPLFFFLLSTQPKNKCIAINWTMTTTLVILRSISDSAYLLNMVLQVITLSKLLFYYVVDMSTRRLGPQIFVIAMIPSVVIFYVSN